eukprot:CAMPEP_0197542034 /NCGR_PEP_ID=MMETSP1318-20131121/67489_1 /TAXON_ID=552666 /ORGANISM="Partenskyella glossopodia, Strain RCC365" /LENGTH=592 /DNA_ID=CAMNT_0043101271 /DNA_START=21 /DNA_END=1799 /DNA_ORIENTATION=+
MSESKGDGKTSMALKAPLTYVLFGATGDLARKKLFPALGWLMEDGYIPKNTKIIGTGRREAKVEDVLKKQGVKVPENQKKFLYPQISYMKAKDAEDFKAIDAAIRKYAGDGPDNRVFFFSLPPFAYASVAEMVKKYCYSSTGFTRCILEKPFGRDSESFEQLAKATSAHFKETELYRIDHYLGKEVVLTLLPLRFSNQIFEPLWCNQMVQSVEICWKEDLNTKGRGGYFDKYGIIRDIIQNHLLQVLIFIGMEKPKDMSAEATQEAKLNFLKAIKTVEMKDVILGQFTRRKYCKHCVDPENPGYLDDETVPKGSKVPTYAMIKLEVDNDRWRGVPFLVSAGKALDERKCEVRIRFKAEESRIFGQLGTNELVIRIQPDESIYFKINVKEPGLDVAVSPQVLDLSYIRAFEGARYGDAYERMLLNCALAKQSLFVGTQELVEAWRIFTPLLHQIDEKKPQPILYPFGTSGPQGYKKFAQNAGVKLKETWQEFFHMHAREVHKLKATFDKYATDGVLLNKDIKAMMTNFYDGRSPTQKMINQFLKAFDENDDGDVTWEEFRKGAYLFMPWKATKRTISMTGEDFDSFAGNFGEY